jgi:sterol 3beta-glucosyltransferase
MPGPPSRKARQRGRLTVIATGSRGDVQPQVALAARLQQAGYRVRFATHRSFADLVLAGGLEHAVLAGDSAKFFGGVGGIALREKLQQPGAAASFVESLLGPFVRRFLAECVEISRDADAILYWPPSLVGPPLSERLGIPCFAVATYPLPHCRTRAFPNPWHPDAQAPGGVGRSGAANERSWAAGESLWSRFFHREVARWRCEQLGLAELSPDQERRRIRRLPHLLGFSPAVLPRPLDWPASMAVTGYWFLDLARGFTPPPALLDFLAAGPPPVAIGFGSMASRDPRAMTELAIAALEQAGVRGILLTGWGGLRQRELPAALFQIDAVPHDWLFPRVAAVVHHGGSGTTAAALRAGAPSLAVPFGFDQSLWAERLFHLGAGVEPIPQDELSLDRLAAALRRLTGDPELRRRAAELAARIAAEDGTGNAVAVVDRYLGVRE